MKISKFIKAGAIGLMSLAVSSGMAFATEDCTTVDTSKGNLTTKYVMENNETIMGEVDATGCDIGVYIPIGVKNAIVSAEVHDANKYGVFNNGNVKVDESEIYNIGQHDGFGNYAPNGTQTGLGVYFFDASGSVVNSNVHDYQKGGIAINGDSKANVTDNIIGGFDPIPFIAQNGIQFGYGATGNVMNNSVTGNWYEGAGWSSTGILLFETNKVTVQGNSVEDSQTGIGIQSWCWFEQSADNNNIIGNNVIGSDWGISVAAYDLTGLYGSSYGNCHATASNNNITNNTITSENGEEGVSVWAYAYPTATYDPMADNNKVIHNIISGFATEISRFGDMSSKVHANVIE